ncbi:MAG TPA: hypothetical protein PKB06_05275, partial [Actinotalea sp.]|nr:hypothetical protein [Actinotalea sp.]
MAVKLGLDAKLYRNTGTPMRVAGWRHPVVIDLAGLSIPSQSRPIRFGHDPLSGVGHTDAVRVEDGQLVATGLVSRDTPAVREVVTSARNGFPRQASVGAGVEEFEFVKESQQVLVNGRTFTGPLNVVRKSTLSEISFVDLGANGRCWPMGAALVSLPRLHTLEFDHHVRRFRVDGRRPRFADPLFALPLSDDAGYLQLVAVEFVDAEHVG